MSIFPSAAQEVTYLRTNHLPAMIASGILPVMPSDALITEKIVAAEAEVERKLRTYLTPREIVPDDTPQEEIDALTQAGQTVAFEPGYDYDPALFQGNTFGLITLRQRPIITVRQIIFAYPGLGDPVYSVPIEWVRADRKYGLVNLVPTQSAQLLPLNAYILSVLGGGRNIPLMLRIKYRAGLENATATYPDLPSLIRQQAKIMLVDDAMMPGSSSVSADGLSQSITWDGAKEQEKLDKKLDALADKMRGPRFAVL